MAAVRRSGFGLQCLSEEERIDLEAMMTLYWHRRVEKEAVIKLLESSQCFRTHVVPTRMEFVDRRSRSPDGHRAVELPVRAFDCGVSSNIGKGASKGCLRLHGSMPDSLEEALQRHRQFVHIHSDLIVRPEEQVPADGQQLYAMLAEEDGTLYAMIRRHLPPGSCGDEDAIGIIARLAKTSQWLADKHNTVEQERQSSRDSSVSSHSESGSAKTEIYVYDCK
jgi:hypothetical protein